jgi:hypothetical protein
MAPSKSVYGEYRENGSGTLPPQGTIVQQSHWGWSVASVLLILAVLFMIFFPVQAAQVFQFFSLN